MIFKAVETTKGVSQIKSFAEEHTLQFKTAQILMQRGIDNDEKYKKFVSPTLDDLRDPFLLFDMKLCHDRIDEAIKKNQRVLLFGDYDVDGISAIAILHKFLKDKITDLYYFLPNRYEDGYGLTIDTSKKIIAKFSPQLIITVDCGISCAEEVEYIKSQGIDIIITDHHEIPEKLPNTIVVDPKRANQTYGFDGLCGAGVAMKVVETFVGRQNLTEYLPICAIATVSDIVPLVDENRAIVKLGLAKQEFLPIGIKMLVKSMKISNITSQIISFKIAPKLNATGRMGNAYFSLDLYLLSDQKTLKESLKKVEELNTLRQKLSQEIYDECLELIKKDKLYKSKAIILKNEKWDSGLLGIACARLVDDFYRPVFLFSDVDGVLKGSVRSIDGINIHKVLSNCNEYLETFGGHSMAAGLSLKLEHFDEFKAEINNYLINNTNQKSYLPIKTYDVAVKADELNLELAKELELLEPFGCENPNPQFMITYNDCNVARMPYLKNHINITISGRKFVSFNASDYIDDYIYADTKQTIVELQINEFKGKKSLTGIVKKTLFYDYGKNLQQIANGRILKQQIKKQKYEKYIDFFDINQAKVLFDKLLLNSDNGTAIIIYNKTTFDKFKSLLNEYKLNYYIGGSQSKFEENCVVLTLNDILDVSSYQNLIFLDTILSTNFLTGFHGDVYALKNSITNLDKLNLSHSYFGIIYKAIKNTLDKKANYNSDIELFFALKKINPQLNKLNFSNFLAALYTFIEIGVLKFSSEDEYELSINESTKTSLENSTFYNNIRFLDIIS